MSFGYPCTPLVYFDPILLKHPIVHTLGLVFISSVIHTLNRSKSNLPSCFPVKVYVHFVCSLRKERISLMCLTPVQKKETLAYGDANMRNLQRGEVLQLERKGYFRCDVPFIRPSKPIVLFAIPDGRQQASLK